MLERRKRGTSGSTYLWKTREPPTFETCVPRPRRRCQPSLTASSPRFCRQSNGGGSPPLSPCPFQEEQEVPLPSQDLPQVRGHAPSSPPSPCHRHTCHTCHPPPGGTGEKEALLPTIKMLGNSTDSASTQISTSFSSTSLDTSFLY